jgi:hypothetical protein
MQRWLPAILRRAAPAGGAARLFSSSSLLFDETQEQVRARPVSRRHSEIATAIPPPLLA